MTSMDAILDAYFDSVVGELERSSLLARRRRLQLVEWLSSAVRGWCRAEGTGDPTQAVAAAASRAIRYHGEARAANGGVCRSGKYHDILYVAAKLCHDWRLRDPGPPASLLAEMYACEGSFERLLSAALVGVKAAHVVCGWRSDFASREEGARAAGYFLEQAARARLEHGVARLRTADVPVDTYGGAPPARVALQLADADMLRLVLRHGARLSMPEDLEPVLQRLGVGRGAARSADVACLRLVLRAVPSMCAPDLGAGLVPPSRCGLQPPELKHLSRCTVREALWRNFQLPLGIPLLPLPASLCDYLDLSED